MLLDAVALVLCALGVELEVLEVTPGDPPDAVLDAATVLLPVVLVRVPGAVLLDKMELVVCAGFCATWTPIIATATMASTKSAPAAIAVVFMSDTRVAARKRNPVKQAFHLKRDEVTKLQLLQERKS